MPKTYIVYCATSPSAKKYVGCTSLGLQARIAAHRRSAARFPGYKFYRATIKYGFSSFVWEVLGEFSTSDAMYEAEKRWIERLGTRTDGYNITAGGEGATGRKNSPDQSIAHGERQRRRFSDLEQRAMASASIVGWLAQNPDAHRENAARRSETLRSEAHRFRAAEQQSAYAKANPQAMVALGATLRKMHENNPVVGAKISKALGGREFHVLVDGIIIATYQSVERCARDLGALAGNIRFCLRGRRNHTKGFCFKYSAAGTDLPPSAAIKADQNLADCSSSVIPGCSG